MDNQTNQAILVTTAGFAAAGIAGYMYLNRSKDVESENAKLGTTKLSDLTPDNKEETKTNWWSNFWGQEHKKQKVLEQLKEQQVESSLYN